MPPTRAVPQDRPRAALFAALAVALTVIAVWLQVPALPILWLGMLIATFQTQPPQVTGKGIGGVPEPVGPEVAKMAAYRRWLQLRAGLLPGPAWNPWPFSANTLIAAAVALAAWVLPTTLTRLWEMCTLAASTLWRTTFTPPDVDIQWLPVANIVAAYVLVQAYASVLGTADDGAEPAPKVTVVALWRVARGNVYWYVTCGLVLAALTAVGVVGAFVLADSRLAEIIPPAWPLAPAAAIIGFATFLHIAAGGPVRAAWRQRTEARTTWQQRFASIPKATATPTLVDHRRLGDDGSWWIDTFDIPATLGAARDLVNKPDQYRLAAGADVDVTVTSTLSVVNGEPQPNTRHPSRIDIITTPAGATLDVTDPRIDSDQLTEWLRVAIARAASRAGVNTILVDGIEPLHDPAAADTRACWLVNASHPDPEVLVETFFKYAGESLQAELGAEIVEDRGRGRFLVGAFDDSVTFTDDSVRDLYRLHHRRLELETAWSQTSSKFPAHPQFEVESTTTIGRVELHKLPHAVPKGQPVERYLSLPVQEIATALPGIVKAAFAYYPADRVAGGREGEPHSAAFTLLWTTTRTPIAPHTIAPIGEVRGGKPVTRRNGRPVLNDSNRNGIRDLLSMSVYDAFTAAKLQLPYLVSVTPLTSPDSRGHLWALDLRLFGRTVIGGLRTKATMQVLQNAFDAAYLRVSESDVGARIIVGADPQTVTFLSDSERGELLRADWEHAFLDANLTAGGRGPVWLDFEPLEHNPRVVAVTFELPNGLTMSKVRSRVEQLRGSTRNRFVDVRRPAGVGENEIVVLASVDDPVPTPAAWDWEFAEATDGIAFGVGVEGEPLQWEPEENPHLVVLGATRSGKSVTMLAYLCGALLRGMDLLMADTQKGLADFTMMRSYARAFVTETVQLAAMGKFLADELDRRTALARQHGVANYLDLPADVRPRHMLICVDEFTSLAQSVAGKLKPPQPDASQEVHEAFAVEAEKYAAVNQFVAAIGRVLREGGAWGVSLMLSGQSLTKADADALGVGLGTFKNNSAVFALGAMRSGAYLSAFGEVPDVELGEEVPRGRGIFRNLAGGYEIAQTWFDGPDRADNVAAILDHIARHREVLQPHELVDLDSIADSVQGPRVFGQLLDDADGSSSEPVATEDLAGLFATAPVVEVDFADLDLTQVESVDLGLSIGDFAALDDEDAAAADVADEPADDADDTVADDAADDEDADDEDADDEDADDEDADDEDADGDWLDAFRLDDAPHDAPPDDPEPSGESASSTHAPELVADPFGFAPPVSAPSDDPFGFDEDRSDVDLADPDDLFGAAAADTSASGSTKPATQPQLIEDDLGDLFGGSR